MSLLKLVFALTPIMVAGDLLWLGVIMKDFYRGNLGHLMASSVQWMPALFFYVLFVTGLLYFATIPGIQSGSFTRTFLMGAAFGLVAYGTYDLTNQATLRDWPLVVTLADMAWGAFFSGTLSAVAFLFSRWWS